MSHSSGVPGADDIIVVIPDAVDITVVAMYLVLMTSLLLCTLMRMTSL
jgi:hypothetical protein